jgi:alpha-amylase
VRNADCSNRSTSSTPGRVVTGGRRRHRRTLLARAAWLSAVTALVVAMVAGAANATPNRAAAGHQGSIAVNSNRDVVANLFEWNWVSVGRECTTQLGPAGYAAVQVAPPQDSVKRTALGNGSDVDLHPWWEVYQPVDYGLTSRMGNEAQFKTMVKTCRKAGVKVIVDAVINHMTGQGALSYGGVSYSKYSYGTLYGPTDFHSYPQNCPVAPAAGSTDREGAIQDYNDYTQVFNCELSSLADLRTDTNYVRTQLAGYLNKLLGDGVSGFRVDAAKHIGQTDLLAIESRLHKTVDGQKPFIALEVGAGSPGRISPNAFEGVGKLLGFDFAQQIDNAFRSYSSPPNDGNIGDLKYFGASTGLLPSKDALAFVQNHDTERSNNASSLNYTDPNNVIANEFMLAWNYGQPQVYSGFAFPSSDTSASPPSDPNGMITDTNCTDGTWVCVDRDVAGMVGFHNYTYGAPVLHWYDDGVNLIAFSRGAKGWITINNETTAQTHTFTTGLPAGTYCDIVHGKKAGHTCTGGSVTVNGRGQATVTVAAFDAVAIDAANKIR